MCPILFIYGGFSTFFRKKIEIKKKEESLVFHASLNFAECEKKQSHWHDSSDEYNLCLGFDSEISWKNY